MEDLLFKIVSGLLALLFLYRLWISGSMCGKTTPQQPPEAAGRWPVIGHLHLLGGAQPLARTFADMADKCGPTFTVWLGMQRTLIVNSWDVAKECLTTNDKVLATRPRYAAAEHMGYNYAMFGFAPYGAYWREIRKIATLELLSNRRLELLCHVRAGELDIAIRDVYQAWIKNQNRPVKLEMKQWFGDLTFNMSVMMIAGKRYFGSNVSCDDEAEARDFRGSMLKYFYLTGVFVVSDALPFLRWLDLQGHEAAMKRTAEEMDVLVRRWVEEHREKKRSSEADFIDVMLATLEEAKISGYDSDTIIKATSLALILGGTDTTTVTLTWALSLLLNHPRVLKKVQDELDMCVGPHRNVDESDFKNLPYLQSVVKETMRLYPAAPLSVPHEATEDCHVSGYYVPAGTRVLVNLWKIHRDPHNWEEPLEFRPERFLTGQQAKVDVRGQHFEYIPFGSGRRSCPGISFALQVIHLTLARLVHSFELSTLNGTPVDMKEGLGLTIPKATPLEVLFSPRLPSNLYI